MKWKYMLCGSLAAASTSLYAADQNDDIKQQAIAAGTFEEVMPDNNLHRRTNANAGSLTQARFNQIIDQVIAIYDPVVRSHGANLTFIRSWNNETVNAQAYQVGNNWYVEMFGGLARAPEVTEDGFALVACHEMGHHLAGFPFYSGGNSWAASEGQSDYFASQSCASELWRNADNSAYATRIPTIPKNACDANWPDQLDRELCYRVALAGKSLADLLAAGNRTTVSFATKDNNRVTQTIEGHPGAQCRLDTYVNGGLCNVAFDIYTIPGVDAPLGRNSLYAEQAAAFYSCESVTKILRSGVINNAPRPRCWYKPQLTDGTTNVQ
ncbi:hypothetical protein [Cellvibrio mixtus]|uniref:hypothetical protein n=1 Tax=Cellvibrio mixtus TaxID=39650 RepID=UPI000693DECB|nr:hypothetical protein [Cellvibrio mixtus]